MQHARQIPLTSSSKARSAPARPASRGASAEHLGRSCCWSNRSQPVPAGSTRTWRATRCRHSCSSCSSASTRCATWRSLTCSARDRRRFPARERPAVRAPDAERRRATRCTGRFTTHLKPQAPRPDLVIYLQAQPETLVERVRRRGSRCRAHDHATTIWRGWRTLCAVFPPLRRRPGADRQFRNLNFVERPRILIYLFQRIDRDARPSRILQPGGDRSMRIP